MNSSLAAFSFGQIFYFDDDNESFDDDQQWGQSGCWQTDSLQTFGAFFCSWSVWFQSNHLLNKIDSRKTSTRASTKNSRKGLEWNIILLQSSFVLPTVRWSLSKRGVGERKNFAFFIYISKSDRKLAQKKCACRGDCSCE